ncbi:MAG: urease accessory protein [Candidatus Sedimenticola sp. (ex Thyasira tokunagai)]
MLSVILLGFLIGMQHATEADHMAAVASLATRSRSARETARQGLFWGVGHTLTLFLFGGLVLIMDSLVPQQLSHLLELAVGVMLVLLGGDVLRRLIRDRIHFHSHHHGETLHFHAHSHSPGKPHNEEAHHHNHPQRLPLRSLLVGMTHGMAGSAALIVLALESVSSIAQGLLYIALFGAGSILGMILLAMVISLPLRYSAGTLTWAHNGLLAMVGLVTVGVGGHMIYQFGML